jgi:3-deoxy-D-manno-octulosonate 8-phosphate phosphatase (KDO 8-P phosphatase)
MGDDWPDLPVMQRCALSCAPPNAHLEVRAMAHHVTQAPGGCGAVRELCDLLLVASGKYAALLQEAAR